MACHFFKKGLPHCLKKSHRNGEIYRSTGLHVDKNNRRLITRAGQQNQELTDTKESRESQGSKYEMGHKRRTTNEKKNGATDPDAMDVSFTQMHLTRKNNS